MTHFNLQPGDILESTSLWGRTRIQITAVGEEFVLAREVQRQFPMHRETPEFDPVECRWNLALREWSLVGNVA